MKTLREKYTERLLSLGAVPVATRSSKYHVFEYTFSVTKRGVTAEHTRFVFLGKSGGVRTNTRNAITDSLSQPLWLMTKLNAADAQDSSVKPSV